MARQQSINILLGIFLLSFAYSAQSYMHSEQQRIISFLSDGGVSFDEGPIRNLLNNPLIADRKVIVYSIAGNQKRKSFIMNYALRFMYANYKSVNLENDKPRKSSKWVGSPNEALTGFSWKATEKIDRINAEIVVWSDIFLYEDSINSYAILLMDTQGLYDTELSVTNNANILALNALFSTFFIYNVEYPMQAEKYENLRLSLQHANKVLETKVSHGGGDLKVKPFNDFVFLFRDVERKDEDNWGFNGGNRFVNKYFKFTDKAYLESFHINSVYDHVYGFSMPPPGDEVSQINYDGRFSQLDEDFQSQLQDFIGEIFSPRHFKPKKIFGQDLTVRDYLMSVKVFCRSVKGNEIAPTNLIYKSEIDQQLKNLIDGFKFEMKGLDQTMVNSFLNVVENERFKLVITLLQLHDNKNKLEKNDPMRNVNQILENGAVRDFESWLRTFHGVFLNSASIKINKENIGTIFDQSVVMRDGLKQLAHIVEEQQKVFLNSFQNVRNECEESANSTFNLMSNKYDRMISQQIKKVQDVCETKDAILTRKIENLSNGLVDTVSDKERNLVFYKIGSYQEGKNLKVFYIPRFLRSYWSGARSICKAYGMDIASFETSKQMLAVSEMCNKNSEKITTGWVNVGGITLTLGSTTDWFWVTSGEKVSYSMKWASLEPNNDGGLEHCLSIGAKSFYNEGFLFNDINCNGPYENQFMCEKVLG